MSITESKTVRAHILKAVGPPDQFGVWETEEVNVPGIGLVDRRIKMHSDIVSTFDEAQAIAGMYARKNPGKTFMPGPVIYKIGDEVDVEERQFALWKSALIATLTDERSIADGKQAIVEQAEAVLKALNEHSDDT